MKFLKCVIVFWSLEFDLQPAYAELILDEVIAISKEIGRFPVQVAKNWLQQKDAPKVGTNLKKILNHLN
ncbi:unnamed protein product [Rhizophagus irregularis]|nr:unnamed protein product [Rhizophagus irregularis]